MKIFAKLFCSICMLFLTKLASAIPVITVNGTFSAFVSCSGVVSTAQSYTVGGTGLSAGITITPPVGYEVSTSSTFASTIGTNASPLVLAQSGGTVSTTTVYARLSTTATGSPVGDIANASTGATTQNIAVTGTVNAAATWAGTTSNSWATATNWLGCVPSTTMGAIVPVVTSPAVYPVVSANANTNDLFINAGASLSISSGITLSMLGDTLANYGTISGDGKVEIKGTATSTKITGNGLTANLHLNSTANATVGADAADSLQLTGVFTQAAGQLTTGGKMVLKSTADATASIGVGVGSTYISGMVTVERYIPSNSRKKYVLLTASLSSSSAPTIYNSWQEGGAATTGYGTQITGATGSNLSTTGFDAVSASGTASAFTYNDALASGSKWVGIANTKSTTWGLGKALLLYVRGDRTIAPGAGSSNTVLRAKGNLYLSSAGFGNSFFPAGANKYQLFGNLYACPVDWTLLTKTNLTVFFTVCDPNLGVFVTSDGTTKSPNVGNQHVKYIQGGQAFFVQAGPTGTYALNFTEAAKAPTVSTAVNGTVFRNSSDKAQMNINVFGANDNEFTDGVVARFDGSYQVGIGNEDAGKMENFNAPSFALSRNGQLLSIEGRPLVASSSDSLFFSMIGFAKKDYVLKIDAANLDLENAQLIDRYTNQKNMLSLTDTTAYRFTINNDPASVSGSRFVIVLTAKPVMAVANNLTVKLSPNPAKAVLKVSFAAPVTDEAWLVNIVNNSGQVVKTVRAGSTGSMMIDVNHLPAGLYHLQLLSGDKKIATKKFVKE